MKKHSVWKIWVGLLVALAWLVTLGLVIVLPYLDYYENHYTPPPDPEIARTITRQLGIEPPSWYTILSYLYYDAAQPGATLEEVHRTLDQIGPWRAEYVGPPKKMIRGTLLIPGAYQEVIVFVEENTYRALYRWIFVYDEEGRLLEKRCVRTKERSVPAPSSGRAGP